VPNRASRESSRYRDHARHLASTLKSARQQQALSQQELAQRANVAIGTVRALEAGRTVEPGFFTVLVLAHALDMDIPTLLEAAQPSLQPPGAT
jgi:transcriptional regulator with XRE-family HTH domain